MADVLGGTNTSRPLGKNRSSMAFKNQRPKAGGSFTRAPPSLRRHPKPSTGQFGVNSPRFGSLSAPVKKLPPLPAQKKQLPPMPQSRPPKRPSPKAPGSRPPPPPSRDRLPSLRQRRPSKPAPKSPRVPKKAPPRVVPKKAPPRVVPKQNAPPRVVPKQKAPPTIAPKKKIPPPRIPPKTRPLARTEPRNLPKTPNKEDDNLNSGEILRMGGNIGSADRKSIRFKKKVMQNITPGIVRQFSVRAIKRAEIASVKISLSKELSASNKSCPIGVTEAPDVAVASLQHSAYRLTIDPKELDNDFLNQQSDLSDKKGENVNEEAYLPTRKASESSDTLPSFSDSFNSGEEDTDSNRESVFIFDNPGLTKKESIFVFDNLRATSSTTLTSARRKREMTVDGFDFKTDSLESPPTHARVLQHRLRKKNHSRTSSAPIDMKSNKRARPKPLSKHKASLIRQPTIRMSPSSSVNKASLIPKSLGSSSTGPDTESKSSITQPSIRGSNSSSSRPKNRTGSRPTRKRTNTHRKQQSSSLRGSNSRRKHGLQVSPKQSLPNRVRRRSGSLDFALLDDKMDEIEYMSEEDEGDSTSEQEQKHLYRMSSFSFRNVSREDTSCYVKLPVTVSLLAHQLLKHDHSRYSCYKILVDMPHNRWFIYRRYSQFSKLNQELRLLPNSRHVTSKFPGKKLLYNTSPHFVDKRQEKLQAWIQMVVSDKELLKNRFVQNFLAHNQEEINNPESKIYTGWLNKQDNFGGWKRIWVSLRGNVLFKYQSEKAKHPYGYYDVLDAGEFTLEERIKHKRYFTFWVQETKKKLTMAAYTETSYQSWIKAIKESTKPPPEQPRPVTKTLPKLKTEVICLK